MELLKAGDRRISRRSFLRGTAVAAGALALRNVPLAEAAAHYFEGGEVPMTPEELASYQPAAGMGEVQPKDKAALLLKLREDYSRYGGGAVPVLAIGVGTPYAENMKKHILDRLKDDIAEGKPEKFQHCQNPEKLMSELVARMTGEASSLTIESAFAKEFISKKGDVNAVLYLWVVMDGVRRIVILPTATVGTSFGFPDKSPTDWCNKNYNEQPTSDPELLAGYYANAIKLLTGVDACPEVKCEDNGEKVPVAVPIPAEAEQPSEEAAKAMGTIVAWGAVGAAVALVLAGGKKVLAG